MAEPIVPVGNIRKGGEEALSVLIAAKNWFSVISAARNMIDSAWKFLNQVYHGGTRGTSPL
jgi:hypothetical protein